MDGAQTVSLPRSRATLRWRASQDLPPTSVALLLVSVSAEMQQQLLAEATALGIVRKIRLLLALQSVNK